MKAGATCMKPRSFQTRAPAEPTSSGTAIIMLNCGPESPIPAPRCRLVVSNRLETVNKPAMSLRKARSDLAGSRTGRVAVNPRAGAALRVNVFRIFNQVRLNRYPQRVMNGVVHLPEAGDAGELNDLRWRQMRLQPVIDFIGHRARIARRGPHVVEAGAF